MTPEELIAFLSSEGFDINDYQPNETDSPSQAQAKVDFIQSIDDLQNVPDKPEPVTCMVNCVIAYLQCGSSAPCWILLQNCVGNCSQQ